MKNKILKAVCYLLAALIFLMGMLIFIYPLVNKAVIDNNAQENLQTFRNMRVVQEESVPENSQTQVEKEDFAELYEDMQRYNQRIYREGQSGLQDAWSYEQSGFDLTAYGIYNGVIGEIRIPKMNCDLPLYMGATMSNMAKGAAQLGQTSTPVGGENTNCVIAGHRGAAGGEFFKEIQLLQTGDRVYIDNLWDSLTYQVVKTEIIYPDEIDKVLIQEGKDMITLTTCHPYPYNTQRYIVYCERVSDDNSSENNTEENTQKTDTQTQATETQMNETEIQETELIQNTASQDSSSLFMDIEYALYIIIPVILIVLFVVLTVFGRRKK